ncbi:MAG: glycosyltransferase [Bdellovibrionia bacterium]
MKIRIYAPGFPHPITEGMHQIVADQLTTFLSMKHDVELVSILQSVDDIEARAPQKLAELEARGLKLTSLAGESFWKKIGIEKMFRVGRSLVSGLASPELFYYPDGLARRQAWDEVDLAIYHYSFAYSWLRDSDRRGEKNRVTYFHNLESDLFDLRAKSESGRVAKTVHGLNALKLRKHERILAKYCDELWFLSPVDRKALLPFAHNKLLRLTPPGYEEAIRNRRQKTFLARTKGGPMDLRIGFIGGLDFAPNHDSAKWILENAAPALANGNFTGRLVIAGRGASEELKRLGSRFSFVEFTGFIEDLEDYWSRLSLSLVPHVSGSGVRMKLLESVASGVPCLANSEAISRLHPDVQKSPFVVRCDRIDDWARSILNEKPFQTRLSLAGVPHNPGLEGRKIYEFLV